jgi:hypothetical protein
VPLLCQTELLWKLHFSEEFNFDFKTGVLLRPRLKCYLKLHSFERVFILDISLCSTSYKTVYVCHRQNQVYHIVLHNNWLHVSTNYKVILRPLEHKFRITVARYFDFIVEKISHLVCDNISCVDGTSNCSAISEKKRMLSAHKRKVVLNKLRRRMRLRV